MRSILFPGIVLMVFLFGGLAGVSGCATMEGVGEDVQSGGEAIEDAAERHRPD